jgi:hypothetical protein
VRDGAAVVSRLGCPGDEVVVVVFNALDSLDTLHDTGSISTTTRAR